VASEDGEITAYETKLTKREVDEVGAELRDTDLNGESPDRKMLKEKEWERGQAIDQGMSSGANGLASQMQMPILTVLKPLENHDLDLLIAVWYRDMELRYGNTIGWCETY